MELIKERIEALEKIPLLKGAHQPPNGVKEFCVMEAVAWVAGEPHSDHPACASKVIGAVLRRWNDEVDDTERAKLKPYIVRLAGTAGTPEVEERRAWMLADWFARAYAPTWMEAIGFKDQAAALRALPAVTSPAGLEAALPVVQSFRDSAASAASAAEARNFPAGLRDGLWDGLRDGLWAGLWDGLRAGLWAGLWDGLWDGLRAGLWDGLRAGLWDGLRAGLWAGLWDGLRAGLWAGLWDGLRAGLWDGLWEKAKTVTTWNEAYKLGYDEAKKIALARAPDVAPHAESIVTSFYALVDKLIEIR